jgi:transposase
MNVTQIGIDLAKLVFQVHGVDARGKVSLRKQLKRHQIVAYFAQVPPSYCPNNRTMSFDGMRSCSIGQDV